MSVRKIPTRMVPKVWGRDQLPPPFTTPESERIGEIWFEPPDEFRDLLVKYLFTSEKLSVQVHPSSSNVKDNEAGKEECWFVLEAEPRAKIAVGFEREVSPAEIEAAARNGTIEALLKWHDVETGDLFYLPAGTVHAIGAGLSLVEVQQNSDTTFRLYDYGRPRELHLERALAVAVCGPYAAKHRGKSAELGQTLVDGPHFRLDRVVGEPDAQTCAVYSSDMFVLPLAGEVESADGTERVGPGECFYASDVSNLDFKRAEITLLTCKKR